MTPSDGMVDAHTTRLAGTVHQLRKEYGWPIATDMVQVPTSDGRVVEVAKYSLPNQVIAAAQASGTEAFVREVTAARAALLAHSQKAAGWGSAEEGH